MEEFEMSIKGFKGFDKDLKCRGFQYELGKDYEEEKAKACDCGFHFCENPLDVFNYYAPATSRFCEVEGDGQISKDNDDSKVATSKIHIGFEIGLKGLIEAGVKFIYDKVNWENAKESNNEDNSAATNTGYQSAATNTGNRSAASVEGKESIACGLGIENKAKGILGAWLVLAEWYEDENCDWHLKEVKSALVDGGKIKENTWYKLLNGEFVEVEEDEE
jgi:hypothetical protein